MELVAEKYKQTEVGLIPSDWDVKKLGDIASLKRGKFTPRPRNNPIYYGGEIPFVQTGDVTKSNGKIINYTQTLNEEGLAVSALFKKGTILMTIAANIGYTGILQIDMACPDSLVAINGLGETDNNFLNFYFSFRREKLEELATTGAQMNLNIERLSPFSIPLPPTKAEQTAIATALSDADALISCLEKLIAKKRNIKQGAMQKLLQPKEGWVVKKLGEICLILNNLRIPIKESSRTKGETPYYGANGIQGYIEGFTHNGEYVLVAEDGANDLSNYPINYTRGKIWVNNHAHVLQGMISILSTKFLSYILKSIDFQDVLVGGTRAKLNKSILEKIDIPFPSLIEQTRITTILSDMDSEISALETKLEKYRKVKLGMMQNLLTGKIRLIGN